MLMLASAKARKFFFELDRIVILEGACLKSYTILQKNTDKTNTDFSA